MLMGRLSVNLLFRCLSIFGLLAAILFTATPSPGDEFTYFDAEGDTQTVHARLAGSDQGFFALELADGQLLLVAEGNIQKREAGADPEPLKAEAVAKNLAETFGGDDKVIAHVDDPHILVYIPQQQITDKKEKGRKVALLKDAAKYLYSMERKFSEHVKAYRLDDRPFRFPLITIIFEEDGDFEEYTRKVTSNTAGLSAGAIAGFYDALSNYLVLRESECATFEVPLHESIHQQVFNRQILQRMAPVPLWFHEGLANAFEGDGKTIKKGPRAVNERYCQQSLAAEQVTWDEVVRSDRTFQSDNTAGEAYGHAWGLHWLMVNNHRNEYSSYVKYLSQLKPLELVDETERVEQLEAIANTSVEKLHAEFLQKIRAALKKINRNGAAFDRRFDDVPRTAISETLFARHTPRVDRRPELPFTTLMSLRSPPVESPPVKVRLRTDTPAEQSAVRSDLSRWLNSGIDFSVPVQQRWRAKR